MTLPSRLCLLLVSVACIAIGVVNGQERNETAVKETQAVPLDKAIASAVAAQRQKLPVTTPARVVSKIVEEAPEATLASGDGDVSTTGECEDDIDEYCKDVEPGHGRLADCLTKRIRQEAKGDEDESVSDDCKEEVAQFMMDRATNINKDVPLARACRADVKRVCANVTSDTDGRAVIRCLRSKRPQLSPLCGRLVFKAMVQEAQDFRINPDLREACSSDAEALCRGAQFGRQGAVIECLMTARSKTTGLCQDQLQRLEQERSEDVRLNPRIQAVCSQEIRSFCKDVEFGEARVYRCLEDNRLKDGFGMACRQAVESVIQRQSSDYKLNFGLSQACKADIAMLCADEREQIELTEGASADSQVITCLETQRAKIKSTACKTEVARQLVRESQDIRFDHTLAQKCFSDREKFCADVQPGSARVIRCLQDHQSELDPDCAASLLDHEVKLAEDIDMKFPLKQACLVEMDLFCKNVPSGHARVVRCLQNKIEHPDMSSECRAEVRRDQEASAKDYRLNFRLHQACMADVRTHCQELAHTCAADTKGCSGRVLRCLRDHMEELQGEECKSEVLYFVKMEVTNYRNDVALAEACKSDVESFCANVKPGEGRVHSCLRQRMDELSDDCRREELKLAILQARDVRLRPKLEKICSGELAVFCRTVSPGNGRMFRCLQDNMGKGDFGEECRNELSKRMQFSQQNWRLDYGVSAQCGADVDALCAAEKGQAHARAAVLKCLINKYQSASEPCQSELSRSVRMALWDYKPGGALTGVCDADVAASCPPTASQGTAQRSMFTIGVVGRCLSRQAAEQKPLQPGCKQLIMVAAPKDAKALFEDTYSVDAIATRVAEIARAAGLSSTFVAPAGTGTSAITLTGWAALAGILASIAVVAGLAVWGVRRWATGGRGQYTLVVKQGDV